MPSGIVIRSPRPNNLRIAVLKQSLTAEGEPTGEPEHIAILDDGAEYVTEVGLHACIVLVELGRDASAIAHHGPAAQHEEIAVIGGQTAAVAADPHLQQHSLQPAAAHTITMVRSPEDLAAAASAISIDLPAGTKAAIGPIPRAVTKAG